MFFPMYENIEFYRRKEKQVKSSYQFEVEHEYLINIVSLESTQFEINCYGKKIHENLSFFSSKEIG